MSRKTYISINSPSLVTTVRADGGDKVVRFRREHGASACGNGVFSTDDEALQRALESDSAFGIDYGLCAQEPQKPLSSRQVEYKDVECVHNRQTAIEWAASELSLELSARMTGPQIRRQLARKGYRFPRWTEREVKQ